MGYDPIEEADQAVRAESELKLYGSCESRKEENYAGLPRICSECGTLSHYDIGRKKKSGMVSCPICDHEFVVTRYKKGERPQR